MRQQASPGRARTLASEAARERGGTRAQREHMRGVRNRHASGRRSIAPRTAAHARLVRAIVDNRLGHGRAAGVHHALGAAAGGPPETLTGAEHAVRFGIIALAHWAQWGGEWDEKLSRGGVSAA